jgi:hypothetical protein
MATNNQNTNAQPMNTRVQARVRIITRESYVDNDGHVVYVRRSGYLTSKAEVARHQKGNNVREGEINIPLKGVRLQRSVDNVLVLNKESDYQFAHPSVFHHGNRTNIQQWMVVVDGEVYRTSDPKRNYARRLRDLVNVCRRFEEID